MEQRAVSGAIPAADYLVDVDAVACSDAGAVRLENEDNYLCESPAFFVADGMGGHRFGRLASTAAIEALAPLAGDEIPEPSRVLDTVAAAHRAVAAIDRGRSASGTTLAGVSLVADPQDRVPRWLVLNVGDSRVYEISGRALSQITVDHSAVQELVDAGELTPQLAESHPERNVITRALGIDEAVTPDVWLLPLRDEQAFLICSDGLTKELRDDQIADVVAASAPADTAEKLVSAALAQGGRDNVTVVVVRASARRADGTPDAQLAGLDETEDTLPSAR